MDSQPSSNEVPVFLCYRQVDGSEAADWLYRHLNERTIEALRETRKLSVYFDRGAPATGDWKAVHQPSLERARALVFIATPGAFSKTSNDDWVHKELNWWILNRTTPPIVVDTTGEGERWIPHPVRKMWPDCQRVVFRPNTWDAAEIPSQTERLVHQIVEGIRLSETGVLFEDVEQHKRLLRRSRTMLISTALLAILAAIGMGLTLRLNDQLTRSNERLDAAVLRAEEAVQRANEAYSSAELSAKVQRRATLEFLELVIAAQADAKSNLMAAHNSLFVGPPSHAKEKRKWELLSHIEQAEKQLDGLLALKRELRLSSEGYPAFPPDTESIE